MEWNWNFPSFFHVLIIWWQTKVQGFYPPHHSHCNHQDPPLHSHRNHQDPPLHSHRNHQAGNLFRNLFQLLRLYFVNIIKVADWFICHWFISSDKMTRITNSHQRRESVGVLLLYNIPMSRININMCPAPPSSLTGYWKSFYLFLILTVWGPRYYTSHTPCSLFLSLWPGEIHLLCHLWGGRTGNEENSLIASQEIGHLHFPCLVSVQTLECCQSWLLATGYIMILYLFIEITAMVLGNSPVIKMIGYGPLEEQYNV